MTTKQNAVKKYVVKLGEEEHAHLVTMIRTGRHPAWRITKARIPLKTDASEVAAGWSDSQVSAALDTTFATVSRTRQLLVEERFKAVLIRKHSPASARRRILDGAAEAKLIALACSKPPKRRVR